MMTQRHSFEECRVFVLVKRNLIGKGEHYA
jgi:hypothetical protein